ncbi:DUF2339 domain-containing protein [Xanthomonadaceae bacterium JHOS43]|nr:DUF2339 domain-containing protein [Xanthomonadaceae bacterium JHOS43]
MHWLMALIGMFLGALVGGGGSAFAGLVFGAVLGWQWARSRELRQRMDALESRMRTDAAIRAALKSAERPASAEPPPTPVRDTMPTDATAPSLPAFTEAIAATTPLSVGVPDEPVSASATSERPATASEHAPATTGSAPTLQPDPITSTPRASTPLPPNALERTLSSARDWLLTGNVPVKIGVLVLLFGIAAALKYSVDEGWVSVPLPLRLALVAAIGLAAVIWGWRNRVSRPAFGVSLQGGGIGVLLLTIFAAYRLYQLLPASIAFSLVLVLIAGAAALAVLQDAMALAVLGFLGGYLAPVLLSTGSGNHVALFSFYAVLNLAVFAIAWLRHWRALNLIGFFFTFAIGLGWGLSYYRPEHVRSVEPFLILFFVFYVAIVVLHALRSPEGKHGVIDGTLLFGTPLLAFPLQAAMLKDQPMALAWSALCVAVLYAVLAWWLLRAKKVVLLGQSFGVLAVGFATLAIPLAFSARWTCTAWALEGVALVWLGLRQHRVLPQIAGHLLQCLAAVAYAVSLLADGWRAAPGEWMVLNGHALCVLLLSGAALAISRLYDRAGTHRLLVWPGFLLGTFWWFWAGLREIEQHVAPFSIHAPGVGTASAWVGFAAITLLVMAALRRALDWPRPGWNVLLALCVSLPLGFATQADAPSALHWPLAGYWLAWVLAALFALAMLRSPAQRGLGVGHILFLLTVALVYGLALNRIARDASLGTDWVFVVTLMPLIVMAALIWRAPRLGAFPLAREFEQHATGWFSLSGVVLGFAWLQALALSGATAPLPYVPLINPVELLQLIGLIIAARWTFKRLPEQAPWLVAIACFLFVTLVGLRGVHHFAEAPWTTAILDNGIAQATLTVLWSIAGVAAWIMGSRRQQWGLWLAGAIGMGVVLLKLVLVDREYVGNLAGIVSFIAVGGLLVLVGRIAPTPPRNEPATNEDVA